MFDTCTTMEPTRQVAGVQILFLGTGWLQNAEIAQVTCGVIVMSIAPEGMFLIFVWGGIKTCL